MKGLLIVNTGSPATPNPKDARAFIEAMLSDPLVMTLPDWFRTILVKGIIGPFRQFSAAKKYRQIWDEDKEDSPLIDSAKRLAVGLEEKLQIPVEVGMTYLEPSISSAFNKMQERGLELEEVIVLPLFPHYAESSYQATVVEVKKQFEKQKYSFPIRIIEPYFNHPAYIKALSMSIEPYTREDYDRIVFNFHSLPISHVEKGFELGKEFDYVYQLKETVRLVSEELNLPAKKIRVAYSSAFGKDWLEPSLDDQVKDMAKSGVKKLLAVSPGFAADNLETLYDIDIKAKQIFLSNGGGELVYIPCLNYEQSWIDAIQQIIA